MAHTKASKSAAVRARLDHPVIDGDGHWLEPIPIFLDYLKDTAGSAVVDKFIKKAKDTTWYDLPPEERMRRRLHRPTWWGEPANTLDRATAMIPRLFYERLDDFGIDFCLLYTSLGLFFVGNPDEEIRRGVSRAVNRMNADLFKPYAHRIAPAAVVPVHTPQEAIEEATYAVRELGLKVVMIANHVRRPVPAFMREGAPLNEVRTYVDSLAFESAHDYDPFWQRCADLKVAVTAHSGSMGTNWRESVWSFTYNHIGHFANASHAFAKALILGGVTHRFPQLRFAMLEGGVGWACNLVTDLVGHWERRRRDAWRARPSPRTSIAGSSSSSSASTAAPPTTGRWASCSPRSTPPSRSRAPRRRPSGPTASRSSTTSPRSPCSRARSSAGTSPSGSSSAARPTTR